jgi:hypothetical protein
MLFKDAKEIAKHVEIDTNTSMEKLRPSIEAAELFVAKNILSVAQYDALHAAYLAVANENELSGGNAALLAKVRPVVANYMMARAVQSLQIQVSGAGSHIQSNDVRKTAFQWQIDAAVKLYTRAGDAAADALLEFLEENKLSYALWAASSIYSAWKSFFVFSTAQFQQLMNINNSRVMMLLMQPTMKYVQDTHILNTLGETYYNSLQAEVVSGNVSADNQKVLNRVRRAIVFLTAKEALTEMTISIDEDGALVRTSSSTEVVSVKNQLPDSRLSKLIESYSKKGAEAIADLQEFLNTNATSSLYADYFNSDRYSDPANASDVFTNPTDAGIGLF